METLALLKSGQLAGCKELKLAGSLSEFPQAIFDLADSLELLVLSNHQISCLPDDFDRLQHLKVLFLNNNRFTEFPAVLAKCPQLSMVSFKGNQIRQISDRALSDTIRWLILTDNQITHLPPSIGKLTRLQKLMLAGNQLQDLPSEMANCRNLELIRLSANRLQTLPPWLLSLPKLAWLAYAGNPLSKKLAHSKSATQPSDKPSLEQLPVVDETAIEFHQPLGEGASGVIYQGLWTAPSGPVTVAVKIFKGEITSDGLPLDERLACIAAGVHPNLVTAIAQLAPRKSDGKAGLLFSLIPADYQSLGNPPSLETCTRDTYRPETSFSLPVVLQIAQGIAAAAAHLHSRGIMHGDLYAHNILINEVGEAFLGDFGAASFYETVDAELSGELDGEWGRSLERLESRAFGCLLEDLLNHCDLGADLASNLDSDSGANSNLAEEVAKSCLRDLQHSCLQETPTMRPLFTNICKKLSAIASSLE